MYAYINICVYKYIYGCLCVCCGVYDFSDFISFHFINIIYSYPLELVSLRRICLFRKESSS